MAEKKTARERTLEAVAAAGWTLDPEARRAAGRYDRTQVQNPHVFLKPVADGSGDTWRLVLDYNAAGWQGGDGNLLKSATIYRFAPGEEKLSYQDVHKRQLALFNSDKSSYRATSFLFKVTSRAHAQGLGWVEKDRTLSERLLVLAQAPEAVVWFAKAEEWEDNVERKAAAREANRIMLAREQPLPITVGEGAHGYKSDWSSISGQISIAAARVRAADGISDLPVLLAALQDKMQAAINVLNEEAAERFFALVEKE